MESVSDTTVYMLQFVLRVHFKPNVYVFCVLLSCAVHVIDAVLFPQGPTGGKGKVSLTILTRHNDVFVPKVVSN
jgi:hypothetical protein